MHVCATCLSRPGLCSLAGVHFSISWKEGTGVRCGSGLSSDPQKRFILTPAVQTEGV